MRRRSLLLVAAIALGAVLAVGLLQSGGATAPRSDAAPTAAELRERLAGAPAPLGRLHARGNQLLPAARARRELEALNGYPVVVNKWASWCGPCRAEFPAFQRVSADLGKQVAFLGVDAGDARAPAAKFLSEFPTSFPHLFDPELEAVEALGIAGSFWPTTAFFDADGKQTHVRQGPYLSANDLRADIEKYAAPRR